MTADDLEAIFDEVVLRVDNWNHLDRQADNCPAGERDAAREKAEIAKDEVMQYLSHLVARQEPAYTWLGGAS